MQPLSATLDQEQHTFHNAHSRIEAMLEQYQPIDETERLAFETARILAEAGDAEAAELEMSDVLARRRYRVGGPLNTSR
jgi:hypothetical protein